MPDAPLVPPPAEPTGRRWALAFLGFVLLVHTFQAIRLFPSLSSIVDDQPVVMVDHAIHEYHGALGARFLREAGTTWGIDPYFMAAYPETPVWDSSSNLSILFQWLAGGYSPRAYKLGLFVCSLLVVAMVPLAGWAAGVRSAEAACAAALTCFYFWGGYPGGLWRSGLFAFVTTAAAIALMLALCERFDRRPTRLLWLGLTACGALLFFAHVTAPIMLAGGLLAYYRAVVRRHDRWWNASIVGAAILAIVANLFWLVPLWRFRDIRQGGAFFFTTESPLFIARYFLGLELDGHLGVTLLLLGIAGLVGWSRDGRGTLVAAFTGCALGLFLLGTAGNFWGPTKVLEPIRFLIALSLLMTIPAGSTVFRITRWLARVTGGGRRGAALAISVWLALLGAGGVAFPRTFKTLVGFKPLAVGLAPEMTQLVDWLRANTDGSARILFEDQLRILETTDPESTHWTPLLPILIGSDSRQFIGGLYQTAFIRHHQMASFGDFHLGDQTIDAWDPVLLRSYCDLYNVGWVVCWSPLSRFWLDRFGGAERIATIPRYGTPHLAPPIVPTESDRIANWAGPGVAARYMADGEQQYVIYRVERPRSFVLRGQAKIAAVDFNRIELANLVPHEGSILLSLHWIDGWRTDPPARIDPEVVPFDPVDFVRIDLPGPVPKLTIFNGYGRR